MIYAIMAQITGKGNIYFFIVPPSGGTPVFTYVEEADNDANKNSALIRIGIRRYKDCPNELSFYLKK
ncbi:MAG: hypothetical protein WAU61_02765 [Smithella sp.]